MKPVSWAIFVVICALYAVGAYFGWLTRAQDNGGSWGTGSLAPSIAFAVTTFMFPLVGMLIATRRPGNSIAWLLLGIGLCWGLDAVASSTATYGLEMHHGSQQAARVAAAFDNVLWLPAIGLMGTFLILLFPDGHLLSPRWRWVAWLAGVTIALGTATIFFDPGPMSDSSFPKAVNPFGIEPLAGVFGWSRAVVILLPVAILGSAASLVVRYRRSRGDERLQMKWLATAAGLVAVIYGVVEITSISLESPLNTVPPWLQVLQDVALLSFCVIPISIGFAVLRYRLYEIDVIIRRTLVYTVLAAVLIGVYLAGVTILSAAMQTITGQSGTLAVTISTLAVAAVFQPLRSRIQHAVDHRLYRPKYNAAQTLHVFSGTLRDQIELDTLSAGVLDVVNVTLQPRSASLWLRPATPHEPPPDMEKPSTRTSVERVTPITPT